jgi:hypothetical protein
MTRSPTVGVPARTLIRQIRVEIGLKWDGSDVMTCVHRDREALIRLAGNTAQTKASYLPNPGLNTTSSTKYPILHTLRNPYTRTLHKRFVDSNVDVCSWLVLKNIVFLSVGRDSIVGIATRYGLDDPGSNPGGGEIFRTRPDRPWGPPSLLYNGYRVSFPGVKRLGRCVDHPPSSSARVKERIELYLCPPPSLSGPSWPVLGRPLPL